MEPSRDTHATLVDLLDRILDKGLVINADIIISVAGIPLLGVNLRAALAGMETMIKYGVMQAWDEKSRAWESEHRKKNIPALAKGEEITLKMYGSYYYCKGIYNSWSPGYFYLTDKRLILYRQDFDEITFQIPLEEIKALVSKEESHFTNEKIKLVLYLIDKQDHVHLLSVAEMDQFNSAIMQNLEISQHFLEESQVIPEFEEGPIDFLTEGEEVSYRGKNVWYLMPAEGIQHETWRPGHLYLTNKRFCWWYDFEKRLIFDIPVDRITNVKNGMIKTSGLDSKKEKVLDVSYGFNSSESTASFSGGGKIDEWEEALKGFAYGKICVQKAIAT